MTLMKPRNDLFIRLFALTSAWFLTAGLNACWGQGAAEANSIQLIEVPEPTQEELLDHPKNLARWHMKATMYDASGGSLDPLNWEETDSAQSMGALLTDDPTARYAIAPGQSRFVIDLGDFFIIERFNFKSFTAQGDAQLYYSESLEPPNARAWKTLGQHASFTSETIVTPTFQPTETRYLMVVLDISRGGDIGNLGAFGNLSLAEVRLAKSDRDENTATDTSRGTDRNAVKLNYASASADSRIAYVSSGEAPASIAMIDDDVETFYRFDEADEENVVIIDLQEQREVNRVSMLFASGPGEFNFYVLNRLPDDLQETLDQQKETAQDDMAMIQNNGRWEPLLLAQAGGESLGAITDFASGAFVAVFQIPADVFQSLPPTVQQSVQGSEERFRIDFSNLQGQFLIIRFVPTSPGSGLTVYEISLMGDVSADETLYERLSAFEFLTDGFELGPEPTQSVAPPAPPPNVRLPPPVSP